MAVSGKRSFEFRMSKKVAELTQVVHMLFTKNHEREVEIEALKDAYEKEIELVLKDAKSKLDSLHLTIRELEQRTGNRDKNKQHASTDSKETEYKAMIAKLTSELQEEKQESQKSRDLLIQAHRDLEQLRALHRQEIAAKDKDLDWRNKEISRLKSLLDKLEEDLRDKQAQLNKQEEMLKSYDNTRGEIERLTRALREAEKLKDDAMLSKRKLEAEVKSLKRELGRLLASKREFRETPNASVVVSFREGLGLQT